MKGKRAAKVNPERQRQRFSPEFKREAVRLLELGQKPATQLALELGVARNRLYKWQAQLKAHGAFRAPGRPRVSEEVKGSEPFYFRLNTALSRAAFNRWLERIIRT